MALVGDPPLLILDEPMSGLDPIGRRRIRELILRQREEKKTIFFSSHVLGDVEQICDRVGILVKGRLTRKGRIDQLLGAHGRAFEVIAAGLDAAAAARIAAQAERHRTLDELHVFVFADTALANAAVEQLRADGGELVEFNPLRESLEDYFMREQEAPA